MPQYAHSPLEGVPVPSQTPPCPVCGSLNDGVEVGKLGRFGMDVRSIVCHDCTLVYQSPRPDEPAMAKYYAGTYRKHYGDVGCSTSDGRIVMKGDSEYKKVLECWHDTQATIAMRLSPLKANEKILEIGCRNARTLALMRERADVEIYGIEPGPEEAEQARTAGVNCFTGNLQEYEPREEKFDQIQLFHVLEHLHEPLRDLVQLRSWLKPQGRIFIEVPNVYQPYGALELNFFQNAHLTNFSHKSLGELLRRAGFQVTSLADTTTLYAVAIPADISQEALPLNFESNHLRAPEETSDWVAVRLRNYAEIQFMRQQTQGGQLTPEGLSRLCRAVRKPALLPHLIETVSQLAEDLVRGGSVSAAQLLVESAAQGEHPQPVLDAFRKFSDQISAIAA